MRRTALRGPALALLLAIVPASGVGSDQAPWSDWDEGMRSARQLGRPVLVSVYTQWCGWCRRMDREVFARPDVLKYLREKFVTIKLDAEARDPARYQDRSFTSRSLAAHFRVTGYPTTIFLRSGGEHLINVPGFVPPDQFLNLLRYVGDGHFERGVTWQEFTARTAKRAREGR